MTSQPELRREFGRWDLTGVMINATVGAGIIGLPGQVFALVGSWSVAVCLAGGVLMALVASCMAEVGSRFASTGGVYLFIKEAYGPRAGFLAGWLTVVSRLMSFAAIANLAVIYVAGLLPWAARPAGRVAFVTGLTLLLTEPVWRGARMSVAAYNFFTVTKLTLLLGFCVCAAPVVWAHGVAASPLPPIGNWGRALTLLLYALTGLEATVGSNGEMRNPARDLPFALLSGMAVAVLIYCGVLVASQAVVPDLAQSTRPVFDGAVRMLGPGAGAAVVLGSVVSMAGVMFAILFVGSRALFAMATAGQLPARLARLHAGSRIPRLAVALHSIMALGLALSFGFLGAVSAATLTRLVYYAAIAAASVTLRRRGFTETTRPLVLPASILRSGLVVLLCGAVLTQVSGVEMITVGVLVVVGLGLGERFGKARKDVLFEKKNQKTFAHWFRVLMTASARDPLLLLMLGFGFFSGLPLPLSVFTLQQWFTTSGVSVHAVSFTAWLGLSYTLKFLWSPLFDRFPPSAIRHVGRRRFWLFVVQPLLAGSCIALALTDPAVNAVHTALAAGAMAFLSASQDVVIDAWRIETFPQQRQGAALAAYVWGYRTAMLVSGSGAIWLSTVVGWHGAMLAMAALMMLAPVLTFFVAEPDLAPARAAIVGLLANIRRSFVEPLLEFTSRPGAAGVLAFVVLFRVGKVLADNTAAAFYHYGLGLDSRAVAAANFLPSLAGVFAGAAFGGWLVARLGTVRAVLTAGVLQAASLGLYLVLMAVSTAWMLDVKVGGEAFAGAAADTTFLTFVSALCSRSYTATQYALLSSVAALAFHTLAGGAGYGAEALGWAPFYVCTILAGLPALVIMFRLRPHDPQ